MRKARNQNVRINEQMKLGFGTDTYIGGLDFARAVVEEAGVGMLISMLDNNEWYSSLHPRFAEGVVSVALEMGA